MANLPTNRTTANTPAEHVADHNVLHADHNLLEGGSNGQVLTKVAGAAAWATPSGSSVLKDFERKMRTSGNWTLNSTTWANLDTGLDLTLNAAAGDIVEVGMSGRYDSNESVTVSLDVGSLVSAAIVKTWGADAAETSGFNGVPGWFGSYQALHVIGGSVSRAVEAGDISAGVLTLRFRYKTGSATNRVLNGSSNNPLIVWAKNHGPIAS